MFRILLLLVAAVFLGTVPAHAINDGLNGYSGPQLNVRAFNVGCAYSKNETAVLRAALESGGAAAGKTLFVPSGCKILLGTSGAADSVADLASNTTIQCEDGTAGFVLARKSCSGVSDTPGAACTADNQCVNGTCVADANAVTAFAPTEASTYTVFGAAASAKNIAIKNCGIWVNGASGDSPAMGGAGKSWGYCDGTGTSILGAACAQFCNAASGGLEGVACNVNGTCGAGACTIPAGHCKASSGTCGDPPHATNWAASGPGKINPIDFSAASNARVENVTVYDHRRGDFTIKTGASGQVIDSASNGDSLTTPQIATNGWVNYLPNNYVDKGIIAGLATSVVRSTGYGWTAGIHAMGFNTISSSTGGGYGGPSLSGWVGNSDLLISYAGVIADDFRGGSSLYCVLPKFADGYNFIVTNAFCDGNIGSKFIVQGAGNQYIGSRGAWGGRGAVVGLGDQRGLCASGTRSGQVCVFGAGNDATIGCPTGATCAANDLFPAGSAGHFVLGAGSLWHTDQVLETTFLRTTDSKRCVNSDATDLGGPCTVDGDCSMGSCDFLNWNNSLIDGAMFLGSLGKAVDLSTSSVGVAVVADTPSILNWGVFGVSLPGFTTGFKFPAIARVCVGGTNDGTSCAADATCTGSGKCRGQVEGVTISGDASGVTTPLVNWDWSYGDVSGLKGLLATDYQGAPVTLTAGEALTRGQVVSVSTAAANTVTKTTTANPERAVGVVLATTLSTYPAKVLTSGVGACIAQGSVTRGDILKPSGTTDGSVATVSSSSDISIGSALETTTTGLTFDCLIGVTPPIQNTTQTFPKFAYGQNAGTVGMTGCTTFTQATSITHAATSGRTIRLQGFAAADITGGVTRIFTTKIARGADCSAAALVTADTELKSNENTTVALGFTDTGQSGSVSYRLCACADTAASAQFGAGATLQLTEY